MTGAMRADSGKRDWDLVPWRQLEEVVKILEFGARKYDRWNWQKGKHDPGVSPAYAQQPAASRDSLRQRREGRPGVWASPFGPRDL